jgi:group I intron endonuclease
MQTPRIKTEDRSGVMTLRQAVSASSVKFLETRRLKMSCGIYKIENLINGKVYIGQSVHIERRWREHKQDADRLVGKAILKHGEENFIFSILEEPLVSQLDEREIYYIQKFNSLVPNGYNLLSGGYANSNNYTNLSLQNIYEIHGLIIDDIMTFEEIAEKFSVCRRTITRINGGYTYRQDGFSYPLKKKTADIHSCLVCGKEITTKNLYCSIQCSSKSQRKIDRPSSSQLENELRESNFMQVGKKYGVSDNTIRKWCKLYGMSTKAKDYKGKP